MYSYRTFFLLNLNYNNVNFCVLFRLTVFVVVLNISSNPKNVASGEEIHCTRRLQRSYLILNGTREPFDFFQDLETSFVPQEAVLIERCGNSTDADEMSAVNGRFTESPVNAPIRKHRRWLFGQDIREFNHQDYIVNETDALAFWEQSSINRYKNNIVDSSDPITTLQSLTVDITEVDTDDSPHLPLRSVKINADDNSESATRSLSLTTDTDDDSWEPVGNRFSIDSVDSSVPGPPWHRSTENITDSTENITDSPKSAETRFSIDSVDSSVPGPPWHRSTENITDSTENITDSPKSAETSYTINIIDYTEPAVISFFNNTMESSEPYSPGEEPEIIVSLSVEPEIENTTSSGTNTTATPDEEEVNPITNPTYHHIQPPSDSEEDTSSPIPPEMSGDDINFEFWKSSGSKEKIRATQAIKMQQYMNPDADPCDDFYEFACGRWALFNKIPEDRTLYSTFEILRSNLDVILKNLLTLEENQVVVQFPGPNLILNGDISKLFNVEHKEELENVTFETVFDAENQTGGDEIEEIINRLPRFVSPTPYLRDQTEDNVNSGYQIENIDSEDAILKAKYYFQSCLNEDILEQRGGQPLLDLIELFGGWPVLDRTWPRHNLDFIEVMAKLRMFNTDTLMLEFIGLDMKNSKKYIMQFDQTILCLPSKDYYLNKSYKRYLNAYKEYFIEIAVLLGGEEDHVRSSAEEMIDFEIRLAKITTPAEQRNNISDVYRKYTINELEVLIPEFDWHRYLSLVFDKDMDKDELVVILAFNYIKKMAQLVTKTERTVIANYIIWRFIRHRVTNLDNRFRYAKQRFYFIMYGRQQPPPRWRTCVSVVNSDLGMALGATFVKKYFDDDSKQENIDISSEIQQAFKELLINTQWMDDRTKRLAIQKLEAITLRIGYPNFILNEEELNNKYKGLKIDPNKYFENILNILLHETKADQARLHKPVDKTMWNTFPAVVNAYYSRNKNQIMFPAGILQPPFYHKHFPRSLNYGGIGVVIGHEITHGFDDKGRLFNSNGNLERWWSESDIQAFHQRSECIVKQYGNFYVPEVNMYVNGGMTEGENIADNGGVKQAFKAYLQWLQKNGAEDETLPGLNYTNTQLFFINFAQIWCGDSRPETMKNKLRTSVHPPGKFRVIGTLTNLDDFAREFDCPIGSRMNPVEKCSVW